MGTTTRLMLAGIMTANVACGTGAPPLDVPDLPGPAVAPDAGLGDFANGGLLGGGQAADCTPESTNFVYLIDAAGVFYRFDPAALRLTRVGEIHCGSKAQVQSLAVRRDGIAFAEYADGTLHSFDVRTLDCSDLDFATGQHGFTTFGMGFATNGRPGDAPRSDETLYVSQSASMSGGTRALGTIEPSTLRLTVVGAYDTLDARAELTGTGDGRLFGAFEGTPYFVAEIDKADAHILSEVPESMVNAAPNRSSFAFATWGGVFWLFEGPGSSTDVFRYDPTTRATTRAMTIDPEIVGAGVSTCAPIRAPAK